MGATQGVTHNGAERGAGPDAPAAAPAGAAHPGEASLDAARAAVLEAVFREAPSFLHVLRGPDFVFEFANAAYERLVGRRDLLGRPAFAVLPEAAGDGFPARLAEVLATGRPFVGRELPVTLARTPGAPPEARLIDLEYLPLADADGRVTRVLGYGTDVTDQVRARRRSEARLRTVQDASPHGLVLLRPVRAAGMAHPGADGAGVDGAGRVVDFRIQYANPAGARLTGQRADAMVGRTLLELFPATRALGLFDAYVRVVETGGVWEDDVRYVADGLAAGYQLAAVRVGEGADAELVLLYADATARLAAEAERDRLLAELTAERERLRSLVLHMPAPVALLEGAEHRFALVNDAYKRISGGGRDVTGLTPREAFPELAGSGIYELYDRVYATGAPWAGPETLARYDRDGTGVMDTWFDLRLEPVRDREGRVTAILNFAVDVTEQVRARRQVESLLAAERAAHAEAERERERATEERERAEAANRAKSDFLAVMSHELRTPLNAIGGYAQLMELGLQGPVTPEQLAALGRIQRGQQHLLGLINTVLNYAKLEAGHVQYQVVDVPAAEALAEVTALVAPQARAKGLALSAGPCAPSPDGAPLVARADPDKVRQVLLNLLSNAVKFTRGGGALTVGCGRAAGGGPGDRRVTLTVADTGRGIPADQLERVFAPFVQVDQRLTRTEEGTGLGLAISRDLARGMGGDLTAESTPGVGSTFTLTLPAAT